MPLSQFLLALSKLEGEACGIPHLAKNERDMGHPCLVCQEKSWSLRFAKLQG